MSLASIFADFLGGELTAEETAASLYEEYTGKEVEWPKDNPHLHDKKEGGPDV